MSLIGCFIPDRRFAHIDEAARRNLRNDSGIEDLGEWITGRSVLIDNVAYVVVGPWSEVRLSEGNVYAVEARRSRNHGQRRPPRTRVGSRTNP